MSDADGLLGWLAFVVGRTRATSIELRRVNGHRSTEGIRSWAVAPPVDLSELAREIREETARTYACHPAARTPLYLVAWWRQDPNEPPEPVAFMIRPRP